MFKTIVSTIAIFAISLSLLSTNLGSISASAVSHCGFANNARVKVNTNHLIYIVTGSISGETDLTCTLNLQLCGGGKATALKAELKSLGGAGCKSSDSKKVANNALSKTNKTNSKNSIAFNSKKRVTVTSNKTTKTRVSNIASNNTSSNSTTCYRGSGRICKTDNTVDHRGSGRFGVINS